MPVAENLQRILITQVEKGARNSLRKQLKSTAEDKYNECSKFVAAVKRYLLLAEVGKAR